jgi:thiol-disulfide isomerase/thioredoxin
MISGQRRFWLICSAVGLAAAAAGAGLGIWRYGAPGRDDGNAAAVQALLSARLNDVKGDAQTLESWRGRILVINFWATWCAPCREEIPMFVRMQDRYRGQGLQFVGIAFDQPEKVSEFAREFGINYPLLIGGLDTMALMRETGNRVGVLPFTLVMDRHGTVSSRHPGGLKEAKLEAVVRPLL